VRLFAGTSGYSYAPWKGSFYPEKWPAAKMLAYYAGKLPTVEINNTFYRMPNRDLVARWAKEVPDTFRFALKAPQRITHQKKLHDCDSEIVHFADVADALGEKRGPVLFQLPPTMRKDLQRLETFLALLKAKAPTLRAAFEFRHPTWFDDETHQALRTGGAALCISDSEDLATPLVATAGWGYLRLRRQDYDDAAVTVWAGQIAAQPWDETYVFFKHEDEGKGPQLATSLLASPLLASPRQAVAADGTSVS
jgi:uncharacterized protein YecE (DUF72 family)